MASSPIVLIHSGHAAEDRRIRDLVAERYPHLTLLTASTEGEVKRYLPEAEILFAWAFPVEYLPRARNLRWFQVMGAGVERIAAGPKLPLGVVVTNLRGVFGGAMSEYALTYMLAHSQDVRGILRRQRSRDWAPFTPARLEHKTVGIAGLGSIGQEIARRCAAFGMRVIGLRHYPGDVPPVERVYTTAEIDRFLPQCDFLVLVLPHTPETAGLLTPDRLRLLKPSCFLISMGRGSVAREEDLVEALRDGWIAGAALDVFPEEPLSPDSPLWAMDNVFVTPHIAGINRVEDVVSVFLENLARYLRGEPLLYHVDLTRGY